MFCPRCHTELPDAAYACSQCGTVISPSAQASSSSIFYQPQQSSFSYLPSGTPQWPSVVPPIGQMPKGMDAPDQGWSDKPSLAGTKPSTRRGSLGIPAMIAIFLVCVVVGGGLTFGLLKLEGANNQSPAPVILHINTTPAATSTPGGAQVSPTATTTNQLPTPTSFLILSNNDVGLSFKYPSTWAIDPPQLTTQSAVIDTHPSTQNGLLMNLERFSTSGSANFKTTGDVNNNNITQIQNISGLTNFQNVQPTSPQQAIGGVQWDEQDITFSNSNGVVFYFVTIAVKYKNQYYDIFYSAPQNVFSEAVQKYYQPMLSSLKFLS
ncbi:MAG TPA: zinc ribbon domain-containing protein [Ktedonobacteraceae bacterium]|nr:zinc ribbon domain-containing protein [Ktedonobacteraceae bacterium]